MISRLPFSPPKRQNINPMVRDSTFLLQLEQSGNTYQQEAPLRLPSRLTQCSTMDQSVINEQVSFEESALSTAISSFEDRQFFSMQH